MMTHGNPPQSPQRDLRVLIVEDYPDDAALLLEELRRGGYEPVWERVETAAAFEVALAVRTWDVVLADYNLPSFSAPAALRLLQNSGRDLPFIVVSGTIGEDAAVACMKAGAHDYLMKGNLARLVPAIERELRETEVRRERKCAEEALQREAEISAALARVGQELIASLNIPVLLERLCQLTAEVLRCDWSHTLIWQPEEGVFVPASAYGSTPEEWEALRVLRLPRALFRDLLVRLEREPVVNETVAASQPLLLGRIPAQYRLTVALHMALRRRGEIVGIHTAAYRGREELFSPQQERIGRGLAHLASLALENARLIEELEQANHLKSDFVATMSHELRTPLNIIIGYNDLLREGAYGTLTAEQLRTLQQTEAASRQLLDLINATLDLSRLEAGRMPLTLTDLRVADLIGELDAETRELQQESGLHFVWQVAPQVPSVHTDPSKLKMVVRNLITNAVKFTDQGSVTVDAHVRDGGVEIAVADTGIGISAEAVPIIFEPFRQADSSSTRRYGGVGLGLYIARRLLDLLGGTLAVDSEPGHGSTFRVWIPTNTTDRSEAGSRTVH